MKHWKMKKKRRGGVAKDIFAWHENEKVIVFMALSAGNIKTVFLEKECIYLKKTIIILLIHTNSTTNKKVLRDRKSMHLKTYVYGA